jgi:nicotinamide-nucleotide amidase
MSAEILATGDEIRSGALVDSNSAFIARKLEEAGVEVVRHSSVGDDPESLVSILREIACRADVAVVSGGLGPTDDDLTAAAAARAAGVDLVLDPKALESLETFFKARQWVLSPANKKQALLPAGANCLINPVGTAPGVHLKIERCEMFFLPGVPYEMRQMLTTEVIPRLMQLQGQTRGVRLVKTLSTFGLTESSTAEHLAGFEGRFPHIKLGFRAKFPEIHVKLYISGSDKERLQSQLEKAGHWVEQKLGNKVFSKTGESLEQTLGNLLRAQNATLAVAESCTGGLIADLITNVPGSSEYFVFSAVTYANQVKVKILGVAPEILDSHGAVSEETAREMARGVKRVSGATYGLATSGIAGPGGATDGKPVGTICVGIATPDSVTGQRYHFTFDNRRMNKRIFAAMALELLRRKLLGH